jgi:hypothetical protein
MRKDVLKPAVNADNTQFTKPISKGLQPPRPRVEEDKVLVWRERFKTFRFWILDTSVDKGGDALLKDVKRMQAVCSIYPGLRVYLVAILGID